MLSFNEEKHEYRLDGKVVPSVSEIMKGVSCYYYTDDIPPIALEIACNKGTEVHKAIADYLLFDDYDISPKYASYLESFKKWQKDYDPQILYVEQKVTNGEYAGTIDLICKIKDETIIVDYKTSNELHDKLVSIQLTAYQKLCEYSNIQVSNRYALHLTKEGYNFVKLVDRTEIWNSLLNNYRYMKNENK